MTSSRAPFPAPDERISALMGDDDRKASGFKQWAWVISQSARLTPEQLCSVAVARDAGQGTAT